jgi:uracil-DNA glycosylase family 4
MPKYIAGSDRPICDARSLGAKCDACPLSKQRPVSPEVRPSNLVILGESPGPNEDATGQPFSGSNGYRLNKTLKEIGLKRTDIHVTYAVLCYSDSKLSPAEWAKAMECCKPRLDAELGTGKTILACGAKALQATTGHAKITPWMGAPLQSRYGTVVGSISVDFARRKPAYLPVFKRFLSRAARICSVGNEPFKWPRIVIDPAEMEEALLQLLEHCKNGIPCGIDIENNPTTKHIRCIGVGNTELVVSVPVELQLSDSIRTLLRQILSSNCLKVFQNQQFDIVELREAAYELNGPTYDTLLAHAVIAPQLPHDLSFMAAVEFSAERWKTEFRVEGDDKGSGKVLQRFVKAPLAELLPYNGKDVGATVLLKARFDAHLTKVHRGQELLDKIHALDAVALKMRDRGIAVEIANLDGHRVALNAEMSKLYETFRRLIPDMSVVLGKSGIHPSLNKHFFGTLKAQPISISEETGQPSLDSKALQAYVGLYSITKPAVAELARTIFRYRKYSKLVGSYIDNLPVSPDNKVHPWWRVFGARTGRWSATDPGIQTIPKPNVKQGTPGMRDLFMATPGMFLCEADYSQLEVRIIAQLSQDERLLEWFAAGADVHTMTAQGIFKTKDILPQQRELSKKVVHLLNYGGTAETAYKALIVDYPKLRIGEIEHIVKQREKNHPQILAWQDQLKYNAERNGYVEEILSGRRQYYHDGRIVPSEVVNFPVQACAGELANRAILRINSELNWTDEAILAQVHDSILTEGNNKERLVEVVKSAMEQAVELNGVSVKFPVDVKVGTNWAHLEKLK